MVLKSNFSAVIKQLATRLKPGLLCFVASLLLFSFQNSVAFGESAATDSSVQSDIFSSKASFSGRLVSLHLPFESAPAPRDRETPGENEEEDDFDFEDSWVVEPQALFCLFDFANVINRVLHPSCFIQGRSTVPLFILYHSWKSFIA